MKPLGWNLYLIYIIIIGFQSLLLPVTGSEEQIDPTPDVPQSPSDTITIPSTVNSFENDLAGDSHNRPELGLSDNRDSNARLTVAQDITPSTASHQSTEIHLPKTSPSDDNSDMPSVTTLPHSEHVINQESTNTNPAESSSSMPIHTEPAHTTAHGGTAGQSQSSPGESRAVPDGSNLPVDGTRQTTDGYHGTSDTSQGVNGLHMTTHGLDGGSAGGDTESTGNHGPADTTGVTESNADLSKETTLADQSHNQQHTAVVTDATSVQSDAATAPDAGTSHPDTSPTAIPTGDKSEHTYATSVQSDAAAHTTMRVSEAGALVANGSTSDHSVEVTSEPSTSKHDSPDTAAVLLTSLADELHTTAPEPHTIATEIPTNVPELITIDHESHTTSPEASTTFSEAPTAVPEAHTTIPEAPTIVSETPYTIPEAPTSVSEAATTIPEAHTTVSEAATTIPEEHTSVTESHTAVSEEEHGRTTSTHLEHTGSTTLPAIIVDTDHSTTSRPEGDLQGYTQTVTSLETETDGVVNTTLLPSSHGETESSEKHSSVTDPATTEDLTTERTSTEELSTPTALLFVPHDAHTTAATTESQEMTGTSSSEEFMTTSSHLPSSSLETFQPYTAIGPLEASYNSTEETTKEESHTSSTSRELDNTSTETTQSLTYEELLPVTTPSGGAVGVFVSTTERPTVEDEQGFTSGGATSTGSGSSELSGAGETTVTVTTGGPVTTAAPVTTGVPLITTTQEVVAKPITDLTDEEYYNTVTISFHITKDRNPDLLWFDSQLKRELQVFVANSLNFFASTMQKTNGREYLRSGGVHDMGRDKRSVAALPSTGVFPDDVILVHPSPRAIGTELMVTLFAKNVTENNTYAVVPRLMIVYALKEYVIELQILMGLNVTSLNEGIPKDFLVAKASSMLLVIITISVLAVLFLILILALILTKCRAPRRSWSRGMDYTDKHKLKNNDLTQSAEFGHLNSDEECRRDEMKEKTCSNGNSAAHIIPSLYHDDSWVVPLDDVTLDDRKKELEDTRL